jgi:hypothetical protein
MTGRPALHTAGIAEQILRQLTAGRSLRAVCQDHGMPSRRTVMQWVSDDRQGFAARYRQAREFGFHALADQILKIADDARHDRIMRRRMDGTTFTVPNSANIRQARLRIAARQWLPSKALPRHYGKQPHPDAWLPPVDTLAALMKEIEQTNRALAEHNERIERMRTDAAPHAALKLVITRSRWRPGDAAFLVASGLLRLRSQ